MDTGLFFKFSGRINRAKYWIAAIVYAVIGIIFGIIGYITDQSAVVQAVSGIVNIVVFISALAVGIKRLHDRDKSGWYLLIFYVVPGILITASAVVGATAEDSSVIVMILGLISFAIFVWAFVELGCLRGTVGPNRYGPDPIAPTMVAPAAPPPPPLRPA